MPLALAGGVSCSGDSPVEAGHPVMCGMLLWEESRLIGNSTNMAEADRCRSTKKAAAHDFIPGAFALGVKPTSDTSPKHRFSLKRPRPTEDLDMDMASLCIIEVQGGQTVGELADFIALKTADRALRGVFLARRLEKGGRDLYRNEMSLQTHPGDNAFAFHNARNIPVPRIGKQDPIENVRFDVGLSGFSPIIGGGREAMPTFQSWRLDLCAIQPEAPIANNAT